MSIKNREIKVNTSRTFLNIRTTYGLSGKKVFDIGCGYGEYLRLFGGGSAGITTSLNEVEYGKEQTLKIIFGNAERLENITFKDDFDAIWANNLFEHILSPHSFLMKLKNLSHKDTSLILGVPVIPRISMLLNFRWFKGALATNHINFFTYTTLRLTVERAGWNISAVRPFIFKNILLDTLVAPFAPHLYIVAKNNQNFKYPPKKVNEWIDDDYYADFLHITKQK